MTNSEHFFGSPSTLGAALVSDTEADAFDDFAYAERERMEDGWPGDPYERCPHHGDIISNGTFDAPCGGCEHEAAEAGRAWEAEQAEIDRHAREGSRCSEGNDCVPFHWNSGPAADCLMQIFECTGDEIPF